MSGIRTLLMDIDQKVKQWEPQSHSFEATHLVRWKNAYDRYVHCRQKAEFVLDGLAVTPAWNPLLIGAAAVCAELLEAYRGLMSTFSEAVAASERPVSLRPASAASQDGRRPKVLAPREQALHATLSRAGWTDSPLFPVGGRFQSAGTAFPDLVVLQEFDSESFAPC